MGKFPSEFSDWVSIINRLKNKPNVENGIKIINQLLHHNFSRNETIHYRNNSWFSPQVWISRLNSITVKKMRSTSVAENMIDQSKNRSFTRFKRSSSLNLK